MRIVAGKHRGRPLAAPRGTDLRPTADRVRESIFNILDHGAPGGGSRVAGARVLDAFAGTGAMGLEALSRGAAAATFIDIDIGACRINVNKLGEAERSELLRADCLSPPRTDAPCALVFLDPPYGRGLAGPALKALAAAGWIGDGALCVVEFAARESLDAPSGFTVLDRRRFGSAQVMFVECHVAGLKPEPQSA